MDLSYLDLDKEFMTLAIEEAQHALSKDEVPIGAVIVKDGQVVSRAHNLREAWQDATAHAEMVALKEACERLKNWRLMGCTMYVTMEPCPMCAGATMLARVERIVLGAWDPKLGACGSVWDVVRDRRSTHRAEVVGGVLEDECGEIVRDFFAGHRS